MLLPSLWDNLPSFGLLFLIRFLGFILTFSLQSVGRCHIVASSFERVFDFLKLCRVSFSSNN